MLDYSFDVRAFNATTRNLSALQRGIYRDLLDKYYSDEKPLLDDVDRLCWELMLETEEEKEALVFVLCEFFCLSRLGKNGKRYWKLPRAEREIKAYKREQKNNKRHAKFLLGTSEMTSHYKWGTSQLQATTSGRLVTTSQTTSDEKLPTTSVIDSDILVGQLASLSYWERHSAMINILKNQGVKANTRMKANEVKGLFDEHVLRPLQVEKLASTSQTTSDEKLQTTSQTTSGVQVNYKSNAENCVKSEQFDKPITPAYARAVQTLNLNNKENIDNNKNVDNIKIITTHKLSLEKEKINKKEKDFCDVSENDMPQNLPSLPSEPVEPFVSVGLDGVKRGERDLVEPTGQQPALADQATPDGFGVVVDEGLNGETVFVSGVSPEPLSTGDGRKDDFLGVSDKPEPDQLSNPSQNALKSPSRDFNKGGYVSTLANKEKSYSDGFNAFWKVYPNYGRRSNKSGCFELWKKNKLEAVTDQIVEHVIAMRETEGWRTGYEPLALTYLNQNRWEDGAPDQRPMKRRDGTVDNVRPHTDELYWNRHKGEIDEQGFELF